VGSILAEAERAFDLRAPAKSLPLLVKAYEAMGHLPADPWVETKQKDLARVIQGCAGMTLEALAPAATACPGQTVDLQAVALNRSDFPIALESVEMPYGSVSVAPKAALETNKPLTTKVGLKIGETWQFHEVGSQEKDLMAADDAELRGRITLPEPFASPEIAFLMKVGDVSIRYEVPVVYRTVDPVKGELNRPLTVVPPITMEPVEGPHVSIDGPELHIKSITAPIWFDWAPVRFRVWSPIDAGAITIRIPETWSAEFIPPSERSNGQPNNVPTSGMKSWELKELKPGNDLAPGLLFSGRPGTTNGPLLFVATVGGRPYAETLHTIDYPHITPQTLFTPAKIDLLGINLRCDSKHVGYFSGSGDETLQALRSLGCEVTSLTDSDLAEKPLSEYQAIVLGVRAFNTRPKLKNLHAKLMEYVEKGGTLVVQYNTLQELATKDIGPYTFDISRDRVTVEEAPVTFVDPNHPILHVPNEITAKDFEGWVQERGLYFPNKWDDHYSAPLSMADPGEKATKGSLLVANYGKGVFVYTGLSFFRQLPAGVPGAYRLFANLVSAKQPGAAPGGNGGGAGAK
jgi:hypothetical protein